MKRIELVLALGVMSVAFVAADTLGAQVESSACQSSVKAIAGGKLNNAQAQIISRCRYTGPDALARIWLKPDPAPDNLERLIETSAMLRDARLLRSTLGSVQDESLPIKTRLAALRVLASYYNSELSPSMAYLVSGTIGDPIPIVIGREVQDGTSPLRNGSRTEIQRILIRLSRRDPADEISHGALMLRQSLAFSDPSNTPLSANAVRLSAGCGPRVILESTADIDLDLRVRVLKSNYDQRFVINGVRRARRGKLTLALPAGDVIVSFGGNEVARLTDRRATCAPGLTRQ